MNIVISSKHYNSNENTIIALYLYSAAIVDVLRSVLIISGVSSDYNDLIRNVIYIGVFILYFKYMVSNYKKISIIFNNKDYKKQITSEYKQLTKKKLMQKKTMLNQNDHFDSQILPFYYALNISIDDLKNEIVEIKDMFNRV